MQTKKITYRPALEHSKNLNELNLLTEEEALAIAERLAKRHDELMQTNPQYRTLYDQLPDRSFFHSGVPLNERVCANTFTEIGRVLTIVQHKRDWSKRGVAKRSRQAAIRAAAKAAAAEALARKQEEERLAAIAAVQQAKAEIAKRRSDRAKAIGKILHRRAIDRASKKRVFERKNTAKRREAGCCEDRCGTGKCGRINCGEANWVYQLTHNKNFKL